MCSLLIINPERNWYEPLRFMTYGFVHNNFMHLFGNVFCQLFIGIPLELVHDSTRVGMIYLSGIFLAGIGRDMVDELERPLAGGTGTYLLFRTCKI